MSGVLGSLLLGYQASLEKALSLEERGLLGPAAYHLYVALQLRASSILYLVEPGSSHNCSVSLILRLVEKGLRKRGLVELADKVKRIILDYRDAITWAEKVRTLVMYKPTEISQDKITRVKELIRRLDEIWDELVHGQS